eukprot:GILI01003203.1.p1 GENE.GILI01003203.1~~GILI01003203.1.p1  ORF type:complete len:497 (-),score=102.00 GILI01003203.1:801-2291(-)
MIRVFSGSCLSLDEVDHIREVQFVERPHLLGPGVDYFTEDGRPLRPQLCAHTLNKVFSGSALDLNDMGTEDENVAMGADGNRHDPTVSSILAGLQVDQDPIRAQKQKISILVIGAGGYTGSYVVQSFLAAGYTVRAAVDDVNDAQLNGELYALHPDSVRRLTIIGMNVLESSAYRENIRGCKYVIHCGVSAMFTRGAGDNVIRAHTEAVQALFDAVRTYGKGSVKRVIILGSASAFAAASTDPSAAIDESIVKTAGKGVTEAVPYARIAFVNESIRLARMVQVECTILLSTIMLGPSIVRESSEGMRTVLDLSYGSSAFPFAPRMFWNFVDVRDVAEATLHATESEVAKNECFIVSNATLSMSQLGRLIRRGHPHLSAPIYDAPTVLTMVLAPLTNAKVSARYLWKTLGVRRNFDNSKAKSALGISFKPISETVTDSVAELIHNGYLPTSAGAKASAVYSNEVSNSSSLGKAVIAIGILGAAGAAAGYFLRNKARK